MVCKSMKIAGQIFIVFAWYTLFPVPEANALQNHAVILAYFQVGKDVDFSNGVSLKTFKRHLEILERENFHVLSLPEMVQALNAGSKLPEKSVVLTLENSNRDTIQTVAPYLGRKNYPFTIFLTTNNWSVDSDRNYLHQLNKKHDVNYGIHLADYEFHKNVKTFTRKLNRANGTFQDIFGRAPEFFSFPFGLYTVEHRAIIKRYNFSGVFGQQSGVAWQGSKGSVYPRFTMTEAHASPERLRIVASALPFRATEFVPEETFLNTHTPSIGFTLGEDLPYEKPIDCFLSNYGKVPVEKLNDHRLEIRPKLKAMDLRYRLNCTQAVIQHNGEKRWRWLGFLMEINQEHFTLPDEPR